MKAFDRILVIVTRRIGDVLLTTPLIQSARERWPDATVDVLGFAGTLGILRGNPMVNELIEVPGGSGWLQSTALIRKLWRRYDLALITQYSDRAHLYGWIAARHRSGITYASDPSGGWKRRVSDHLEIADHGMTHAVLEKLRLMRPWAEPPAAVSVGLPAPAALPEDIASRLRAGYVVVHAPSLYRYKQWPVAHFQTLVRGLLADGRQVVLTGGPAQADSDMVDAVCQVGQPPELLGLAGRLPFNPLASLIAGASLYIGPDTSVTHLAAACGVPVIALYGPVDPCLWGPWPQGAAPVQPFVPRALSQRVRNVIILQGPQPCVPCNQSGCERHENSRADCLDSLAPERVLAEARTLLGTPVTG
jgi:heptosyltransferase-3